MFFILYKHNNSFGMCYFLSQYYVPKDFYLYKSTINEKIHFSWKSPDHENNYFHKNWSFDITQKKCSNTFQSLVFNSINNYQNGTANVQYHISEMLLLFLIWISILEIQCTRVWLIETVYVSLISLLMGWDNKKPIYVFCTSYIIFLDRQWP